MRLTIWAFWMCFQTGPKHPSKSVDSKQLAFLRIRSLLSDKMSTLDRPQTLFQLMWALVLQRERQSDCVARSDAFGLWPYSQVK